MMDFNKYTSRIPVVVTARISSEGSRQQAVLDNVGRTSVEVRRVARISGRGPWGHGFTLKIRCDFAQIVEITGFHRF